MKFDGFAADPQEPARICVVVPCYNEGRRLAVATFRAFIATNPQIRFLFVDDGSRDSTLEVLKTICADYESRAAILQNNLNKGKAEAVRTGMVCALDDPLNAVVGFWDADLATPLDAIARLLTILDTNPMVEMVFGARVKLLGRHVERLALRHYLGRVFATVVSILLQLPIYDSQNGAKLFRANANAKQVFAEPFLSKWVFDVEIIARYRNLYVNRGASLQNGIYEYPLERWTDVAGSKLRPHDFFTALADIVRIKRRYL